jgi:tryptophan synthase
MTELEGIIICLYMYMTIILIYYLIDIYLGIIPALETSHAIYACVELARTLPKDQNIILCVSGRGDKDTNTVAEVLPKLGPKIGWDLRFE